MNATPALSRRDRLRRVVILCRNFARNLAYYRTGQRPEYESLLDPAHPQVNFWRVMNGNCIDICVLEWCKLFADTKGKHHWGKIVTDHVGFKAGLLSHLGLDEAGFDQEIEAMKVYRDKFVAHLDSERTMNIPVLDIARQSAWFYHAHIVAGEVQPGDLSGLPLELDTGYTQCEAEAGVACQQALRTENE